MAAPVAQAFTASQASTSSNLTGAIFKPSLILDYQISGPAAVDVAVLVSIDAGANWYTATLHNSYAGVNRSTAQDVVLVIDLLATFAANPPLGSGYTGADFRTRCTFSDHAVPADQLVDTRTTIAVSMTKPGATTFTIAADDYVGATGVCPFDIATTGGSTATHYKVGTSAVAADYSGQPSTISDGSGTFTFSGTGMHPDGQYTLHCRVYDQYYNQSIDAVDTVFLLRAAPVIDLQIVGCNGTSDYTGIELQPDGSFVPNRAATVRVSVTSSDPNPVQFRVMASSNCERNIVVNGVTIDVTNPAQQWITLTPSNSEVTLNLVRANKNATTTATAPEDDFDVSDQVWINVEVKDGANNLGYASGTNTIVLNTRIYQTANHPMRKADASYSPIVKEISGGQAVPISQTQAIDELPVRAWATVFYPAAHSEDSTQDPQGQDVYDEDGRLLTTQWTSDGSRNYADMLSSDVNNLAYWALDNTGWGELQLEFEHFNLNTNIFGPPFNPIAPHEGDVLVLYDADDPTALVQNEQGGWEINDSDALVELAAFTGSGPNVMDLCSGRRMNSDQYGGFKSDIIRGVNKLVLVLYTDASGTDSGFKLKAGCKHDNIWTNWHVDEANGQLWVHRWLGVSQVNGLAGEGTKQIIYDWLDGDVSFDYDAGEVIFNTDQTGHTVTVDYGYYESDTRNATSYIATEDDFVAYQEAPVYVLADGVDKVSPEVRLQTYPDDGQGRLTTDYNWDKDMGTLEVTAGMLPAGYRLYADYYHHTFKRLTADGRGDLTFINSIIVADTTPMYPNYTYVDIKVVNEGDALLEDWKLVFVPRGYNTDSNDATDYLNPDQGWAVEEALNINRPWDIQKGTPAETYQKMACEVQDNYLWNRSCSRDQAQVILSNWSNHPVDELAARDHMFGRVVWILTDGQATTPGEKRASLEISGKYYAMAE